MFSYHQYSTKHYAKPKMTSKLAHYLLLKLSVYTIGMPSWQELQSPYLSQQKTQQTSLSKHA
jgi:coproporphyrinogen III oxidase-like Fe-S oxidoreductase